MYSHDQDAWEIIVGSLRRTLLNRGITNAEKTGRCFNSVGTRDYSTLVEFFDNEGKVLHPEDCMKLFYFIGGEKWLKNWAPQVFGEQHALLTAEWLNQEAKNRYEYSRRSID
jgi:hypothetical protein